MLSEVFFSSLHSSSHSLPSLTVTGLSPSPESSSKIRIGTGIAWNISLSRISDGSFSGASSARIPPFSITSTRSAYARTSSNRCSIKRIVVPNSALIFRRVARKSPAARGSSCDVGSSNTRRSGCIAITAARFRSCFCPPESSSTFFSNQVWIPKKLAISATRSRIVPVSYPRFSNPNASSCHTLSVTSWLSGLWST